MPVSCHWFFVPIALIFVLSIISCTTNGPEFQPNPKSQVITNISTKEAATTPSIVVSINNPENLKPKYIFPKTSDLQNLTSNQVHNLLGVPNFQRTDNSAEIWQYRSNKCTLDLFLYENLNTSSLSVAHFEIRLQNDHVLSDEECFKIVIKETTQAG